VQAAGILIIIFGSNPRWQTAVCGPKFTRFWEGPFVDGPSEHVANYDDLRVNTLSMSMTAGEH